ncbi:MAG: cytochrome b [Candidatus Dormibacterales bacterium]
MARPDLRSWLPFRPAATARAAARQTFDWLDERAGLRTLLLETLYHAVPVRGGWAYTLGSATLVLMVNQLVTGIVLTTMYVPSTQEAWQSLQYVKQHDAFGSIVRGMHLWGAYLLLLLIGLHMLRTFFSGSYKRPRELNWVTGVLLFLLVLGLSITGAFLPWDQAAYWTAVVVTNLVRYVPAVGNQLGEMWRGGVFLGPITLVRTYGIHIWVLPAITYSLVGIHLYLLLKHGEFGSYVNYRGAYRSKSGWAEAPPPEARSVEPPYPAAPTEDYWAAPLETEDFHPGQTFKDATLSGLLMIAILLLAIGVGAPLESPANQATTTYTPVPEWFFLPLDQLLVLVPQPLIPLALFLPGAGSLLLLAVPFFDRSPERNPWQRPLVVFPALLMVVFMLVLTALGSGRLFNL